MGRVCAVSFERHGRLYYADPGELTPRIGDKVLYPTSKGPEVAECVWAPEEVEPGDGFASLPVLVGPADSAALERDERNRTVRAEARAVVRRLVREHNLPMKIVGIDYVDATRTVTAYFSAPGRVDFRALVRDLTRELRARVELRQLSARDEARVQGGIGPCGRDLCCSTFLREFEPVSLRMAKDQDLPVNPLRISGACGRLMCCLKYEHPLYQDFERTAPRAGEAVSTPDGDGTVVGRNVPAGTLLISLADSGRRTSCAKADVCPSRQAFEARGSGGRAGH